MKQYMVPRMLFQPIIENAYKHAFKDKHSDYLEPQITVRFEQKYGDLYIYITDNGNGMESETLKKIRKSLNHEPISDSGIGLSNTNRRIKLLFGQRFGISINSKVGKGTEVLMLIPIIIESFKGKPSSKSNYQ